MSDARGDMPEDTLSGRRLLLTGAASGIGRRCLELALADGADCAAIVRNTTEANSLDELLGANRCQVQDLGQSDAVSSATAAALDSLPGPVDACLCCAGIFEHRAGLETDLDDFRRVLDINLTAAFITARDCARVMAGRGYGSIVLVSSQIGLIGHPRAAAYAASKSALNGLVRSLAIELAPRGVRVNAVAPGPIATPMTEAARNDAERAAGLLASIPLGRYGEAGEVAAAARFLLSDAAAFITGQVLCVDGGVTAA
jgi:NAD(P)-dependent dehydrogenase (short-subunit alcohol dehydrogenase family)